MTASPNFAAEWIGYASNDLQAAEVLFNEEIYSQACFHSHQCAEKCLKAFLIFKGESPRRIHDLNELFTLCSRHNADELSKFADDIAALNNFYIPTRYPDAFPGSLPDRLPNEKDAKEAIETAERLLNIIKSLFACDPA